MSQGRVTGKPKRAEGENPPKGALMMVVSSHCHLVILSSVSSCLVSFPCLSACRLVFPPPPLPVRRSPLSRKRLGCFGALSPAR